MKKLYAILPALLIVSIASVNAQTKPSFGIRAGLTMADWQGETTQSLNDLVRITDNKVSTSSRTGFYAGGYMNIAVNEIFSVEPGVYFSQKGYTMKGNLELKELDFLSANATAQVQSSYIDVPLVVRANLAKGLQVYAGPQVSYLAQNNLHVNAGALGISLFQRDIDITDNFNKWDLGLTGGLAYQFENGLNIQAGYEHGLSKLDARNNFKSYNRVVKVGVGFAF